METYNAPIDLLKNKTITNQKKFDPVQQRPSSLTPKERAAGAPPDQTRASPGAGSYDTRATGLAAGSPVNTPRHPIQAHSPACHPGSLA